MHMATFAACQNRRYNRQREHGRTEQLQGKNIYSTPHTLNNLGKISTIRLPPRFSHIVPTVQNIRSNMAAEQQVSAANRRLAQQLANRPGINQSGGGNATALMYQQQQQMMMGGQARGGGRGGRGGPRGAAANKVSQL